MFELVTLSDLELHFLVEFEWVDDDPEIQNFEFCDEKKDNLEKVNPKLYNALEPLLLDELRIVLGDQIDERVAYADRVNRTNSTCRVI